MHAANNWMLAAAIPTPTGLSAPTQAPCITEASQRPAYLDQQRVFPEFHLVVIALVLMFILAAVMSEVFELLYCSILNRFRYRFRRRSHGLITLDGEEKQLHCNDSACCEDKATAASTARVRSNLTLDAAKGPSSTPDPNDHENPLCDWQSGSNLWIL